VSVCTRETALRGKPPAHRMSSRDYSDGDGSDSDGEPRPLVGFLFGNVDNRLRLEKTEGTYIEEVRVASRCRANPGGRNASLKPRDCDRLRVHPLLGPGTRATRRA